jgi:2-dehydro-3-deoxygluconokinase
MKDKVVCFGEIMMRLTPTLDFQILSDAKNYSAWFGGSEANVAVSLAHFGVPVTYITKLPHNEIADNALIFLKGNGIDTSKILQGGDRIGLYFMEKGCRQRAAKVVFDRKHSSFSQLKREELDWGNVFAGVSRFHFSGITPALSPELADITLAAVQEAKSRGVRVSCDLNYRSIWDKVSAKKTMTEICQYVDDCIANDSDVLQIFDYTYSTQEPMSRAKEMAWALTKQFGFRDTAMILLLEDENHMKYTWGFLVSGGKEYESSRYYLEMIDSIGGGDAFAAGLIAADVYGLEPQNRINFAAATSCLKFSMPGDSCNADLEMVRAKITGENQWIKR